MSVARKLDKPRPRAQPRGRVLWALDPFAEDTLLQAKTIKALKALVSKRALQIEPYTIVQWADRYVIPHEIDTLQDIERAALKSITRKVKRWEVPRALPPTIVAEDQVSLSASVRSLILYAKTSGAELVAVGTQSRKGTARFLLGSFAETLVSLSDIPTLVVSPLTKPAEKFRHILFPTDFSEASRKAFSSVVELARDLKATLLIFHRDLRGDRLACEKLARPFTLHAKKKGVNFDLLVESSDTPTVEAILQLSESKPDTLVAMVSQTGSVGASLVGSVTRQVLHRSLCPLWVVHP